MKTKLRLLLAALLLLVLQTQAQLAGSLDPSFASGGIGKYSVSTQPSYGEARSVLTQPDGKIILAGNSGGRAMITRLNANGSTDAGFGQNGVVYFIGSIISAALQSDGKIVLAGSSYNGSYNNFLAVRLNTDGSLDNSFDGDGRLMVPVSGWNEAANSVTIQSDGKIVLAGYSYNYYIYYSGGYPYYYYYYYYSVVRLNGDGTLDNNFVNGGKLVFSINSSYYDQAYSVAIQSNGKIVLAGLSSNGSNLDFSVVRLNADGSFDNSFDGDGKLLIPVGSSTDQANSIAIQSDGKIVLAGYSYNVSNEDFSVVRLNTDGSLDNSFDGDGKLLIPVGSSDDIANSIAIQSDGKIVLAGRSYNGSNNDFSVVRLTNSGSLDIGFDGDGKLLIPVGSSDDIANSIAMQSDGKIVLAGYSYNGSNNNLLVARLTNSGSLDIGFDGDGKLLILLGSSNDQAYSIAMQSDGKIVLAGRSYNGSNDDFSVVRLTNSGSLDNSFDGDGKALIPVGSSTDQAYSIAIQSDGKIVLAGRSYNGSNDDFSVVRLNIDGSLDNSFDGDGKALVPVGSSTDQAYSIAIQSDGKIVLAGRSYNGSNDDFSVVRLNINGSLDISFDGDGKLLIPVGISADVAYSIAMQSDGKIVLAGFSYDGSSNYDFSVVRLNIDGSPDNSFDGDGKLLVPVGSSYDQANSIAIQSDGKILMAGRSSNGSNDDFSVVRLNTDGSLDIGFDGDGKALIPVGSSNDQAYSIAIQGDGKIVLAGRSNNGTNDDFSIVRLNTNGSLDIGFDGDGKALVNSPLYNEYAYASALQPDGNIVVAGYGDADEPGTKFIAMRFLGGSATLTVNPSSLNQLNYIEQAGPSISKSSVITGSGISAGVSVSCPAGFEISDDNTNFVTTTITITPAAGAVNKTIYVRLKAGLPPGNYSGNITVTSAGAASQAIALSGAVTASYAITASVAGNGTVTPGGTTYVTTGTEQVYAITPAWGHHITNVLVDGISVGPVATYTFTNVTATHSIAASFGINTYNVTASSGTGGTIAPAGSVQVNYSGSQVYTISTDACYNIADVQVDGVSVGAVSSYTFDNINVSHTISASFVSAATTSEETHITCDSYTWNGTTYTESGDYTFVSGCNTATLHLTINAPLVVTAVVSDNGEGPVLPEVMIFSGAGQNVTFVGQGPGSKLTGGRTNIYSNINTGSYNGLWWTFAPIENPRHSSQGGSTTGQMVFSSYDPSTRIITFASTANMTWPSVGHTENIATRLRMQLQPYTGSHTGPVAVGLPFVTAGDISLGSLSANYPLIDIKALGATAAYQVWYIIETVGGIPLDDYYGNPAHNSSVGGITVTSQTGSFFSSAPSTCNGGPSTVTVTATGGMAPYTGTGAFSASAGEHTYVVTDAGGCSGSTTITVAPLLQHTYYRDADGDGFGDPSHTITDCSLTPPAGYVTNDDDCDDTKLLYADNDGDSYGAGSPVACGVANNTDCNDNDATVHSGITYYKDADGDGFGDINSPTTECLSTAPSGYVANSTDCDDTKLLYADNDEDGFGTGSPVACGVANNTDCNDADVTAHTPQTYFADNDSDGFGDAANPTTECSSTPPPGYVSNSTDCDDTQKLYADNDEDSYGAGSPVACGVADNTDCNDNDASVHTPVTYYKDADGDGFGSAINTTTECSSIPPTGYVTDNSDCDDTQKLYADSDGDTYGAGSPVACGVANNTDCNDADVTVHTPQTYFADNDSDGFGDAANPTTQCSSTPPPGYVSNSTDCDDTQKLYADNDEDSYGAGSPVACGVADNTDCNDNDASVHTPVTYYKDEDEDGFGDINNSTTVCFSAPPSGYVSNSTDCDDTQKLYADNDGDTYGAGSPVACGVANNTDCNDNDATVHSGIIYYKDVDGDGFGDINSPTTECLSTAPSGYVTNSTDCDDTQKLYADNDGDTYGAGLPVACGVADNTDCNDNDASVHSGITYYRDADGDGFGNASVTTSVCSSTTPTGYVTNSTDCDDSKLLYADSDGDNYGAGSPVACGVANNTDCNDNDASVHSGITYYRDADGDSFGNASVTTSVCSSTTPTGYVTNSTDCDDSRSIVYPGAPEVCDGLDNNCNGQIDEGVKITYYRDADGDGYGNNAVTTQACSTPAGYVTNNTDCNDADATVRPNAPEVCDGKDNDCDGSVDEGVKITYYRDADGDGYGNNAVTTQACSTPAGYVANNTDCNDADATVRPNAPEVCDGKDNDCDGLVDEGVKLTYYRDADGDGYGNNAVTTQACSKPAGYVTNNTDCNDADASIRPNAPEVCDGKDNDCDGSIDEGVKITYYRDADGDGYGNNAITTQACSKPAGYVINNTDCNDADASMRPNAPEICDGKDNDCDGLIDEGVKITYYRDADGDGYGNASVTTPACSKPAGYATNNTDCNDADASIRPNAPEVCDGKDNDCDGLIDEGFTKITYYRDADGDGYGNASVTTQACSKPAGYVTNKTDCNDADATVRPNAPEVCDGKDNDCDGLIDEGVKITYYRDADADGYGTASVATQACSKPAGYVTNNADCNDNNAAVRPGAAEVCGNGIDDNCNGQIDEGCAVSNIQIGITDKTVAEGNTGSKLMTFTVKLNKKSAKLITVNYATQNITATGGSDYQSQSGTLTLPPGVKKVTLFVWVYGDKISEANETFSIALSNPVNATIADATGIGTITNDDRASLIARNTPEETEQQRTVELYPNPAATMAWVSLKGYTGAVTIQVLDMNGKILKQDKVQASMQKFVRQPVDVSSYANGEYLISIIDEKGKRETKKLIIAK